MKIAQASLTALCAIIISAEAAWACDRRDPACVPYGTPHLAQIEAICIRAGSHGLLEMWSFTGGYLLCDVDYGSYDGDVLFERGLDGRLTHLATENNGEGGINFNELGISDTAKENLLYHEHWIAR